MKIREQFLLLLLIFILMFTYSPLKSQGISESNTLRSKLEKGKKLYFEAKFDDAILFLSNFIVELKSKEENTSIIELEADAHIYVACSFAGKGEEEKALMEFKEMLSLAPNRREQVSLDVFGPKIVKILGEAESEFEGQIPKLDRRDLGNERKDIASKNLENKDSALINQIKSQPIKKSGIGENTALKSKARNKTSKKTFTKGNKSSVSSRRETISRTSSKKKLLTKLAKSKKTKSPILSRKKASSSSKKKTSKSTRKISKSSKRKKKKNKSES